MHFFSPDVFQFHLGVLTGYHLGHGIEHHSQQSALVIIRYAHCSDTARAEMALACFACAHLSCECIDKLCIPKNLLIFLIAIKLSLGIFIFILTIRSHIPSTVSLGDCYMEIHKYEDKGHWSH